MKKLALFILIVTVLAAFLIQRHGTHGESRRANLVEPKAGRAQTRAAIAFGLSGTIRAIAKRHSPNVSPVSRSGKFAVRETGFAPPQQAIYPGPAIPDPKPITAEVSGSPMPTPALSFNGLSNFDNIDAYGAVIIPPDTIGDVGPKHYVQAVNALVRIFDKTGDALTPPFRMSQLFAPLGTVCSARDDGGPIVLYDPLADRWMMSQYCTAFPPFRQMIAVSKTSDPTGSYFLYEFVMPNIRLNDFPKFGVWPDAYYMSTEEFTGSDFSGNGMFAFDRTKMLAGDPSASYIYFNRPSASASRLGNLLPADIDGLRPPPDGTPGVFAGYTATEYGDAQDAIRLFDFHADFADPSRSTFSERTESPLPVASFDPTSPPGRADIIQPAPGDKLDANSDRLNYRAAYRNLGTSESIVLNQTVRLLVDPYRAGVRLYELRRTNGIFFVAEQSTLGNADSSRWIGSAAQDNQGNLAVGYNFVSDTKKPSILYAGKLASDPAGVFRDEASLIDGTGVQKAFGWRWGDYSGMSVDPVDDCTFWMTGEYYTLESQNFSDFTWLTRIGQFKYPECTTAPRSVITGAVTNASNGQPIANAVVAVSVWSRASAANGDYGDLAVLPGTYTVTASAGGFRSQSFSVDVVSGQRITQNFSLVPVPVLGVTGIGVSAESCGQNGAPDPGETVTLALSLRNTGPRSTQDLSGTLLTGGGVTAPGPPQNFGAIAAGGRSVTRTFSFTIAPELTCGSQITLTFHLLDGAEDLGSITTVLQTGTPRIAFQQSFERSQQAQLPQRWMRSAVDGMGSTDYRRNWTVSTTRAASGSKSVFSPDVNQTGLSEMVTPVFRIASPIAKLTFRNWYDFETTFLRNRLYDGSVLEIRIDGGDWQDILAAGGSFESGGYDGLLDGCCQNPLAGHPGWSGRSGIDQVSEFITTSVRFPPAAAGQRVQLRWRVGTDVGGSREGQYIDDIVVTDGFTCGCSAP